MKGEWLGGHLHEQMDIFMGEWSDGQNDRERWVGGCMDGWTTSLRHWRMARFRREGQQGWRGAKVTLPFVGLGLNLRRDRDSFWEGCSHRGMAGVAGPRRMAGQAGPAQAVGPSHPLAG